jgi:hypothetical protein
MRFFWIEPWVRGTACAAAAFVLMALAAVAQEPAPADAMASMRAAFAAPPMDARPMMRWWWFGPAVEKNELARELGVMKAGGIGGVEIQPVYALELDDPQTGFRNMPFLSKEFLDRVGFAAQTAHDLDLRLNLTLGSGWPYGGAYVPVTDAAGRLRIVTLEIPDRASSVPIPSLENGESLLAAFVAPGTPQHYDAEHARQTAEIRDRRLMLPSEDSHPRVALFFISSRTGQQVKRAAVGAEGFVLDHFSLQAIQNHLLYVANPLIEACGDNRPYSVFSDSLEVYGADWTPTLLDEFRARRGYDLTPHLPQLAAGVTPEAADLRYDWGRTLAELIDEHYLAPLNDWARAHHTEFRSQSYGTPAVTLASNALVDLPEGEGPQWHDGFSYTRWATSASHIYGRPVTSSETWTWLHSPPFRATPLDMKAEADRFFLQGINQFVGHGWPYSPPSAGDPGWSFYAAAVFNDRNPWWMVMPDVMRYFTRMSYLLRQGSPANDIAVLLPEEDAQARFRPGHVSVTDELRTLLGPDLVPAILDAGYNLDFIDSAAIDAVGIHYPVLVMPATERLPLAAYRKIQQYAQGGGVVIAIKSLPSRAPGAIEGPRDTAAVQQISRALAAPDAKNVKVVASTSDVGAAIGATLKPDMAISPVAPEVGFIHRKLPDADIYFIANTGNRPHTFTATFRTAHDKAEWWDAMSGKVAELGVSTDRADLLGKHWLIFALAPYESRVLVFTDHIDSSSRAVADGPAEPLRPLLGQTFDGTFHMADTRPEIDLTRDWKVTFDKTQKAESMPVLESWTEFEAEKYYSGTATYERAVEIPAEVARAGRVVLDFGEGTPLDPQPLHQPGMRAWYDAPIREAALVYVNGKLAGSLWHPPYQIDVGPLLHAGTNQLKIIVANTAINELAGRAAPDYRLLNQRYGEKFTPQDMDHLEPLPSGIVARVRLIWGQ